MRAFPRLFLAAVLSTGGALVATSGPVHAHPYCVPWASNPTWEGSTIYGQYVVDCSRTVARATLHGRIKEDRNSLPDVVHDHESITFTRDSGGEVRTTTCQDGDAIYMESQINNEGPYQSDRKTMAC
jgi:hypothetical protein